MNKFIKLQKRIYLSIFFILSIYFSFFSFYNSSRRGGDFSTYVKILSSYNKNITKKFEPIFYLLSEYITFLETIPSNIVIAFISTFTYISLIFFIPKLACKKYNNNSVVLLTTALSFPVLTVSQSPIRQGLASVFFTLFLVYKDSIYRFFFLPISFFTHNVFLFYYFLLTLFSLNIINKYIKIFILILISIVSLNFQSQIFFFFGRESHLSYLSRGGNYQIGLRFDFLLFTLLPIILFYIKKIHYEFDQIYNEYFFKLFNIFIICIFLITISFRTPFVDRYCFVVWIYYPVIMSYVISRRLYYLFSICYILLSILYMPQRYIFF